MRDKTVAILALGIIFVAAAAIFLYFKNSDLCTTFSRSKGEMSCQEARKNALKKYAGNFLSIQKTTLPFRGQERNVWLVLIKPANPLLISTPPKKPESKEKETIDALGVAIDRTSKTILFTQQFYKR